MSDVSVRAKQGAFTQTKGKVTSSEVKIEANAQIKRPSLEEIGEVLVEVLMLKNGALTRDSITVESKMTADLGLDSLDLVEVSADLEERFKALGIKIPEGKLKHGSNFGQIVLAIDEVIGARIEALSKKAEKEARSAMNATARLHERMH